MRIVIATTIMWLVAGPAGAQHPDIDHEVERLVPQITEIRHQIHAHPELGNREVVTAALVADYLRALGFDDIRTGVAHTGVVAVLRGEQPGPVVAVRADMDALPVTEETDVPFRSTRRTTYLGQEVGVMHACGHDVHTAVQLGVAAILKARQHDLPGTVMFLFQPAEEGPPPGEEGGAALMLAEGVFSDLRPDAVGDRGAHAVPRVGLAVLQSANLWGRPVTFFACTFAPGAQAVGTISEFFRKMARPAGFEPATLGLEGRPSDPAVSGAIRFQARTR